MAKFHADLAEAGIVPAHSCMSASLLSCCPHATGKQADQPVHSPFCFRMCRVDNAYEPHCLARRAAVKQMSGSAE